MLRLALVCLALAACSKPEPAASPYRDDLITICDAEKRSGALDHDPNQRALVVAQWLGPVIKSQEARDFLATLARTPSIDKGAALRAEARRVGLADCALAAIWK